MSQLINLTRNSFSKTQYPKVIDTNFTQLTPIPTGSIAVEGVSVDEFFILYDELFFDIPKVGNNSHETLITTSTEYIGYEPLNEELIALQQEITSLRQELLQARKELVQQIEIQTNTNG
jgi:hypothetical protein|tara:strand:+ start:39 stop:395 length:357 start_codon:yes stop_codon:yes gene_type:complete